MTAPPARRAAADAALLHEAAGAALLHEAAGAALLHEAAGAAGLLVTAAARWPESDADTAVTPLAGFIESDFSPLIAEVASRALRRRAEPPASGMVTGIVLVTTLGDVTSATRVAAAVDAGARVPPLLFYQSVPYAVAGYLAARWQLTGPVVCVSGTTAGLDAAALLIDDGDVDDALVVRADLAVTDGTGNAAAAVLVTRPDPAAQPDPAGNDP